MSQTDYDLVRQEIASFIGTAVGNWDLRTKQDVDSAIRKGINSVIHNAAGHQFTWMRPVFRLTTADGQRRYTLPADFEQFIDYISFDGENYQHPPITQMPASRLHELHSEYSSTGVPYHYAIEAQSHDGMAQQHHQLALHPTPNGTYQLVGIYQVGPIRQLTEDRPYFPGGAENLELFIAACLAQAQSTFMDGPMTDKQDQFQSELVAAIARDHRRGARNLGQMRGRRVHEFFRHKLSTTYLGGTDL